MANKNFLQGTHEAIISPNAFKKNLISLKENFYANSSRSTKRNSILIVALQNMY
jgi:hypothetical protein